MRIRWEPGAVTGGRDDDFEGVGEVGDRVGGDLVGPSSRQEKPVTHRGARSARAARMAWWTRPGVGVGRLRWPEIAKRYMRAIYQQGWAEPGIKVREVALAPEVGQPHDGVPGA